MEVKRTWWEAEGTELAYRAKSDESRRQAISTMVRGQASWVLTSVLRGWRDLLVTLRQKRVMEKMKEENLAYMAKSDDLLAVTLCFDICP